jgi:hypothetical protein
MTLFFYLVMENGVFFCTGVDSILHILLILRIFADLLVVGMSFCLTVPFEYHKLP